MSSQHVLVIGVDRYDSKVIQDLCGAGPDAEAFATFFRKRGVPENQLTILKNQAATRLAIFKELRRLADDPRIQYGDSIVIFFAGHGIQAPAPPNWEAGGRAAKIQLILPCDAFCAACDQMVAPIPDRTLGALVEAIAHKKGDNITVILDSCCSGSGTRGNDGSYNVVRPSPPPSCCKHSESLNDDICSFVPDSNHGGWRSHVLISASSSSGEARESKGRGVFTVALLELLENCQIDKLRYRDIVMLLDASLKQTPHVEGYNFERYIFTTTSSPIRFFTPVYARINGQMGYVLNGGAAHDLNVDDEFAIYPDFDSPEPEATLIINEVDTFCSIMATRSQGGISLGGQSVAVRVKQGSSPVLRVHIRPGDKAIDIFSLVRDRDGAQGSPNFNMADSPNDCDIDISMQGDHVMVRLINTGSTHLCGTVTELARILKASSQFLSELNRTANCLSTITQDVTVDFYELQISQHRFPGSPVTELIPLSTAIPCDSGVYKLHQGYRYGLKLANNSNHDLYPIVEVFNPTDDFAIDKWYHPGCGLDVPLSCKGTITVGYGSGGSQPLMPTIGQGIVFLKISLFSRPPDPASDVQAFRAARHPCDKHKGSWATIIKKLVSSPAMQSFEDKNCQQPTHIVEYEIKLAN